MGLSRSKGRKQNLTGRLRELTRELDEPVRPPFFVNQPQFRSRTPSMGWWWVPAGADHPVYLGHNHIVAELELRKLIDGQELPT